MTAAPYYDLPKLHGAFRRWFGEDYDLATIDAVLATAAAERLDGDPLWLMVVGGSGSAKTETVQSLAGAGAILTSTISSEGALLSGTPKRDKGKDSTGGLLRRIGNRGLLVIKDFTSILSMGTETRAPVLAASREIYDGFWERNLGVDGGRSLTWTGRIGLIAACTTEWDRAHGVIAAMGDRFVLIRMDSYRGRLAAGRRALGNTGHEEEMRAHLVEAVAGLLARIDPRGVMHPTPEEIARLLAAADLVTLARTAVMTDYKGDVLDAHAPEAPTRFSKQLLQAMRGACAIGLDRRQALRLALRCARDSMPPLRLAILDDLAAHPRSRTREVRQRLDKPFNTVDRQLQALHMLGVLECDEVEGVDQQRSRWFYSLSSSIDPTALYVPGISPHEELGNKECGVTDIPGTCEAANGDSYRT